MDDEPVFYYSRERRLRSAGDAVRRLNAEGPTKRPGLFRTLTATKPLAFLFLAVLMLSLTAVVTAVFLPKDDEGRLGNNRIALSAFRFQGTTYLALVKKAEGKDAYVGPVAMAVSAPAGAAWEQTLHFAPRDEEEFRFALPLDAPRLLVVLQGDGKPVVFQVRPK